MDRGLLRLLIVGYCVVYTVSECPLSLDPPVVVVRYGGPVSVNCTIYGHHEGIGWEASEGSVDIVEDVQFVTWGLEALTDWHTGPKCFGNYFTETGDPSQCTEKLNITVYEPPDSVSISDANYVVTKLEGEQSQLQCEVQNIAPVQYLTIRWYQGERELERQFFSENFTKTPVNVSSTLLITPTSADDGAQYSCVAELELGPEGPQPPPEVRSDPLRITVHYIPFFDSVDQTVDVTEGEKGLLNCSSQANPAAAYHWEAPITEGKMSNKTLSTSSSLPLGTHVYTCTAYNYLGSQRKKFTVNIIPSGDQTVLWTVIGVGLAVAVLLILGYLYLKSKDVGNYVI